MAIANAISLIDRNFVGLLAERIKIDLALSDFQLGLLLGPSFALLYLFFQIPIGWLADRGHRPLIMATGMVLWCAATVAGGFAQTFVGLLLARLAVGLGEAALNPCAMSLIADYVPLQSRGRAISTYVCGALLGAGSSYLIGGQLVAYLDGAPPSAFPLLVGFKTWQSTFIILGTPGLLIALALFFLPEPRRMKSRPDVTGRRPSASFMGAVRIMFQQWRAFGGVLGGMACLGLIGNTNLWAATLFQRVWDWPLERVGLMLGLVNLLSTPPGGALCGWIADKATKRGQWDGPLRAIWIGALMICPTYFLYPVMPNAVMAVALFVIASVGQHIASPAGPLAMIHIAPSQMRSQATGYYYLVYNTIGLFLGPPLIGLLTGMMGGGTALRYSIAGVGLVFGLVSLWVVIAVRPAYVVAARRANEQEPNNLPQHTEGAKV